MLISIAVDYRHADVATRERFHLMEERLSRLYGIDPAGVAPERVGLATCNRSEAYAWVPGAHAEALEPHFGALARAWMGSELAARQLLAVAKRRVGDGAVRHLFRVASGVESQVLGDSQLLGQLRDAHRLAAEGGVTGSVLHRLFERALRVGKRVRTETGLSSGRYSVGAEAANVAARRFGSLAHARVVVVGAGKTGERVARQLVKLGAQDIVVMNRTFARAERLAEQVRGRAAPIEALYGELALADIAIVATAATTPVVFSDPLVSARRRCATMQYPLLLIDLSVPRNIDPAVGHVAGVVVVDLDALRPAVAAGERERCASVPHAEQIVEEELREFREWMRGAAARAAIRPLCDALTEVCRREVAHAVAQGDGAEKAAATAERAAGRIVAKLLARPMVELRGAAARGEALDDLVVALHRLFPGHGRRRGDASDARERARELALRDGERRALRAAARAAGAVGTIGALAATPGLVLAPEAAPIAVHARRRAR
jgi:glutamyl-tRNA reductase